MTAMVGREVKVRWGGVAVAGGRTKTISINNEPIDVTDAEDDGVRHLLAAPAVRSVDISFEGLTKSAQLIKAAAEANTVVDEVEVDIAGIGTIVGDFRLNNVEMGAPHDDAATFTAEFQSAGEYAWADPAAPTNTVLPAISGTAQEGVALTVWPGMWTGNPSFTYQWEEDDSGWVEIANATSATYTPVAGNIGNPLRVVVTGTNSEGSASATSAATPEVIGA